MFENYSEQSLTALYHARVAAAQSQSTVLESDHLLQGLLMENDERIESIFAQFNINLQHLEEEIECEPTDPTDTGNPREIPLSEEVKKILAYAVHELEGTGSSRVGLEHLLLGIMRVDCSASRLLNRHGLNLFTLRETIPGLSDTEEEDPALEGLTQDSVSEYCHDLIEMARQEIFDPLVGRDAELQRMVHILCRRTKNNPLLIGEPGVGKTALVEGLAQAIVAGTVPEPLQNCKILALDMGLLVAGTKYRGQFEERIKGLLSDIAKDEQTILFIDEIHTAIGAGAAEGSLDAANLLKPALSRENLTCIGATTPRDFRRHIEKDRALMRRFQPVDIRPTTEEETIAILKGIRHRYENFHGVAYSDDVLTTIVRRSGQYIADAAFPDKAIDILDEAGAMVKLTMTSERKRAIEVKRELKRLSREIRTAVSSRNFDEAIRLREAAVDVRESYHQMDGEPVDSSLSVTEDDVNRVIAQATGIPVSRLSEGEAQKLSAMEAILHRRIVGQDSALTVLAQAIRRARLGLKNPDRPVGVFLFLGPSGVGKTEVARQLSRSLFHDDQHLIRFDMSEYSERHTVSRLMGAPPGYVGHDEGGQMADRIRRRPYSVILLDEIEKAHPDIHNLLLQVMEEGRATDASGRSIDFRNTIIIMTGNIGSRSMARRVPGFASDSSGTRPVNDIVKRDLEDIFPPEFINRIDHVVIFNPLGRTELKRVAKILLGELREVLSRNRIDISWDESLEELILSKTRLNPASGARPLRAAIREIVESAISDALIRNHQRPIVLRATGHKGEVTIETVSSHPVTTAHP